MLNATAVKLGLGTGGFHFVISNFNNIENEINISNGHIMKMKYTPQQVRCLSLEEESNKYHDIFNNFNSLDDKTYIVGSLHSMLEPLVASIKFINPKFKICYIMTDAGALPISFSNTVRRLKNKGLIENTITVGNAFGGDYECINIYTGIIAAKEIIKADITIITMGPGIVGTNTKFGFSGIEQGHILDAITNLGGKSIAIPRISFNDNRIRHKGISHHTITILKEISIYRTTVIFPELEGEKFDYIKKQIDINNIQDKHDVIVKNGNIVKDALDYFKLNPVTMGRSYEKDKEFFYTLGAIANFVCCN